jgi:glucose/arabinose dehydrogenase
MSLVAACGNSTATPPRTAEPLPSPSVSGVPSASASAPGATAGATATASTLPATPSPSAEAAFDPAKVQLDLRRVVAGLDQPLGIVNAGDGSGRLFIVEQPGIVRIVKAGVLQTTPFLDVSSLVSCCNERGLLGLAFAPGFGSTTRDFYVNYTDKNGDTNVARGTTNAAGQRADASSLKTILKVKQPYPNHNGGNIVFGPDGMLYIGMGDGGSANDPQGNGQSLSTLLGKMLRIDVTTAPTGNATYVIPADNPFVGQAARPEIWSYGLRNPWRWSFDRTLGTLWIGDVGQDRYEEVDRAASGGRGINFGWNIMEARHCFLAQACSRTGFGLPIAEYDHSTGDCAVVGGYVYRGAAFPMLTGAYLFGDECSGRIRSVDAAGPDSQSPTILLDTSHAISSFGEDEAGELYLTDLVSGELYQVTATAR